MIPVTEQILKKVITPRPAESHKGNYGRVVVIAGSHTYGGAGIMSASAALYAGAGLITLISDLVNRTALHAQHPEIMFADWTDQKLVAQLIDGANVIVIGPGLGLDNQAQELLTLTLSQVINAQTLILDGSALTLLSQTPEKKIQSDAQLILTPHQEEWHRLSGLNIAEQTPAKNQEVLAAKFPESTILVLKQHHTQTYADGQIYENTSGSPAMATGGMGDTLTGIIAALVAQFKQPVDATVTAVYLHGLAGQVLAETQYVALPSQLILELPVLMAKYSLK